MERLRALLADANRYFSQLTKRERMLLALAGVSVLVFGGSIVVASVRSSMSRHEISIEEKEGQLKQIAVYAAGYAESERGRREMEGRLGGAPLRLLTHMQELADKNGLVISSMNDRGDTTTDQVKESIVELQIASTPIEKLTQLLNEIERNPRIIKVKKLRVRRGSGDDKSLNVTLTVAAYSLAQKG